jgi:hypothetical protein
VAQTVSLLLTSLVAALLARDARILRESGANVTQMLRAKFAYDVRHAARVHHANVARTCCARNAQQGMLLLNPLHNLDVPGGPGYKPN